MKSLKFFIKNNSKTKKQIIVRYKFLFEEHVESLLNYIVQFIIFVV